MKVLIFALFPSCSLHRPSVQFEPRFANLSPVIVLNETFLVAFRWPFTALSPDIVLPSSFWFLEMRGELNTKAIHLIVCNLLRIYLIWSGVIHACTHLAASNNGVTRISQDEIAGECSNAFNRLPCTTLPPTTTPFYQWITLFPHLSS